MRNKRITTALLTAMIFVLSGCQLADPNDGSGTGRDMLCGMFITTEPLDFGSDEEEINIVPNWDGSFQAVTDPQDSRIYATMRETTIGDSKYWDFTFDGLKGVRFFNAIVKYNGELYSTSTHDNEIIDFNQSGSGTLPRIDDLLSGNYHVESSVSISGTLYTDVHYPVTVFCNPVYQTPDGNVYVTQGNSYYCDSATSGMSASLSDKTTEATNGKITVESMSATLKFVPVNTNQKLVLKQMDSSCHLLAKTEITQDSIPESVKVLPDTDYMLLEEHGLDADNKLVIKRTLLTKEALEFKVCFTNDDGTVDVNSVALEH